MNRCVYAHRLVATTSRHHRQRQQQQELILLSTQSHPAQTLPDTPVRRVALVMRVPVCRFVPRCTQQQLPVALTLMGLRQRRHRRLHLLRRAFPAVSGRQS